MRLQARDRVIGFPRRPLVMGIVNLSADSFSGDGVPAVDKALERAGVLAEAGADIIDVGSETARTNRPAISEAEEIARLKPFLNGYADAFEGRRPADAEQVWPPLLSVNTWRAPVVAAAVESGVDLINDIGGLADPAIARLCGDCGAALLIMHTVGEPKQNHRYVRYGDLWREVLEFFDRQVDLARALGVTTERILLDPGIDFAKSAPENLRILAELERLTGSRPFPVLLPVSRKTVIGEVLGIGDPALRDAGTAACLAAGWRRGAAAFRVHNVSMTWSILRVLHALGGGGIAPRGSVI